MGSMRRDGDQLLTPPRVAFAESLGLAPSRIAFLGAVHGAAAVTTVEPGLVDGFDALATSIPGLALFALFADCYPILLFDPDHRALALVHAGWRGTAAGVAAAAVDLLEREYGSHRERLLAGIGPGACGACYQVGAEVAEHFDAAFSRPDAEGRFRLDLLAANRAALVATGVPEANIEASGICTIEDERLPSHRRDADGGRFACLCAIA